MKLIFLIRSGVALYSHPELRTSQERPLLSSLVHFVPHQGVVNSSLHLFVLSISPPPRQAGWRTFLGVLIPGLLDRGSCASPSLHFTLRIFLFTFWPFLCVSLCDVVYVWLFNPRFPHQLNLCRKSLANIYILTETLCISSQHTQCHN